MFIHLRSCFVIVHCCFVLRICVQSGCFCAAEISLKFLESSHAWVIQSRNVFKQNLLHTCNTFPVPTIHLQDSRFLFSCANKPKLQILLSASQVPQVPQLNISPELHQSVVLGTWGSWSNLLFHRWECTGPQRRNDGFGYHTHLLITTDNLPPFQLIWSWIFEMTQQKS